VAIDTVEDRTFTVRSVWLISVAAVVFYLCVVITISATRGWIVDSRGAPIPVDFAHLYAAGRLALSNEPAIAYDTSVFHRVLAQVLRLPPDVPTPSWVWRYPPIFLFAGAPLAVMPYCAAFLAWVAFTTCLYLVSLFIIIPGRLTVLVALASPAMFANILIGQDGCLTASLIGFSLATLEKRPLLAGASLGLLTYKPQLGLLFPLVLGVAGKWRVFIAATAATLTFGAAAALLFGPQTWGAFVQSLTSSAGSTLMPEVDVWGFQTVFGLMRWLGIGQAAAWMVHSVIALGVAFLVCSIWRRPVPFSLKAASLSTGVLLVTPYALYYDLAVLSVSTAFLIREGLTSGFAPGERTVLFAAFSGFFLFIGIFPIGPIVCVVLIGLILYRVYLARWCSH
jgi:arabinofuranan 3-O-arabinosyltransferase